MKRLLLIAAFSAALHAAPLTVFNSGVDGAGVVLAQGSIDTHYVGVTPSSTVFVTAGLDGLWLNNNATSKWVGPDGVIGDGNYSLIYRTTVNLTGFDVSSAVISGRWATDNNGTNILLNGVATGQTSASFSSFTNFALNSGFVSGLNTIDFAWSNGGGPGGVRVEFTSANANLLEGQTVPEPTSIGLMFGGLAALAYFRRR